MSSLSLQLQAITKNTASVALDRKARSRIHSRSLIYDSKTAATQDYDLIYQTAIQGLYELVDLDSRFSKFQQTLFSETTIDLDRNVQPQDVVDSLNTNIEAFLTLVGPFYSLSCSINALEWLVRRFYCNLHNAETFLTSVLPYHGQPVFVRVLNVIPKSLLPPIYSWLNGYREILQLPPASSILKAFRNDFELLKLYSLFLADLIKNKTVYKEQLVFYLTNAAQVIASYSPEPELVTETYMPVLLEVIGVMLLRQTLSSRKAIAADIKLTAYSLVTVIAAVLDLSLELIDSLTDSILQDPATLENSLRRETIILLGQLWAGCDDYSSKKPSLARISSSTWIEIHDLLLELKAQQYRVDEFFLHCALGSLPEASSHKLFLLVELDVLKGKYHQILPLVLTCIDTSEEGGQHAVSRIIEALIKHDREAFIEELTHNKTSLAELELALMTSLSIADDEDETIIPLASVTEPEIIDEVEAENISADLASHKTTIKTFLTSSVDKDFELLSRILLKLLRTKQFASQSASLALFCETVFSGKDVAVSFLIRLAYTTSIPLTIRLVVLEQVRVELAAVSSAGSVDLYLLVPILLLGFWDQKKAVRTSVVEILILIKKVTIGLHENKQKPKTTLFMEDQIYGPTPAKLRAIVSPKDAMTMLNVAFGSSYVEDCVLDRTRVVSLVFDCLFEASISGSKKIGPLIFKAFILNQWSLPLWPLVLKSRAWSVVGIALLRQGNEDRFVFSEGDLAEFFTKRTSWIVQADIANMNFHDECEDAILSLVGGSGGSIEQTAKEIDWLLRALGSTEGNLQIAANERVKIIFTHIKPIESRLAIVNKLVDLLSSEAYTDIDPMETLQKLDIGHELFLAALSGVQLSSQVPELGTVKRRRRSSQSTKQAMARDDINTIASTHLKRLTVILEILEETLRHNPGDVARPALLTALFKILTDLDYLGNDGNLPVMYAQETLASCMLLAIVCMKSIADDLKFDSNSIRADLIVNSIRTSQSPQVQNRLLLVVAELASLAPEIILHSVMPIFTFMGAHTVRQDDEFSNAALQQTIAKVVPALAQNGTHAASNEIEFLLTSFIAAFQHIPRHRRVKMFASLTKTLGADNCLHAILFLMGQQYVDYAHRKKLSECANILEFSISFMKSFSAQEQLHGVRGFIELWSMIPATPLEANSIEFEALKARHVFGSDILSQNESGLVLLKADLIQFVSEILQTDDTSYSGTGLLKIKVALVLLDPESDNSAKQQVLQEVRDSTSIILSGLDMFTSQSLNKKICDNLHALLGSFLDLLPINFFVDLILDSLLVAKLADGVLAKIARNFAILAGRKIDAELNATNIDEGVVLSVLDNLLPVLIEGFKNSADIELQQSYLDTFATIVSKFGLATTVLADSKYSKILMDALAAISSYNGLLSELPELVVSAINAISSAINVLGVKTIGLLPKIIQPSLKIWQKTTDGEYDADSAQLLQASVVALLATYIKKMPGFLVSSLDSIFMTVLGSELLDTTLRALILAMAVDHMDTTMVVKSLCNVWCVRKIYEAENASIIGLYLTTMQLAVERIDKKGAIAQATTFMKWLISGFEFRNWCVISHSKFDNNTIHRLESSFHTCGINYVMKLNDKSFRPLFASLARWAIDGEGSGLDANTESTRLMAFFRFFHKMQEQLKSIITSYFSYLIDPIARLLTRFATGELEDVNLRRVLLNSLTSSFKYDQDDYWSQQGRFDTISGPLLSQLVNVEDSIGKYLVKCISAFVSDVSLDEHNEKLVNGLIRYIANDNEETSTKSKLWTVRVLKTVFYKMGEQWLSYLPTLVPHIAELLEDDDEEVEMEVRNGLVANIENVLGEPLNRYLN